MEGKLGPRAAAAYRALRRRIVDGDLPEGTQLPAQSELARSLGVAPMTVREALTALRDEGLILSRHGLGTYVTKPTSPRLETLSRIELNQLIDGTEAIPSVGVARVSLDGRLLAANRAFQLMLGYSESELQDFRFADATHPDDIEAGVPLAAQLIAGERDHYQLEKRYLRKDGTTLWTRLTVKLVRDALGRPASALAMIEDISARRQVEEALHDVEQMVHEQRDFLAAVTASLADGLFVTDAEGRLILMNPAAEALLGWTEAELLGRVMHDVIAADTETTLFLSTGAREEIGRAVKGEFRRKDGAVLPVGYTVANMVGRTARGQVVAFVDLSRHAKEVAELERRGERIRFQASLLDAVAEAVVATDAEGAVIYWNEAAEKLYGWPKQEVLGRRLHDVTPTEQPQAEREAMLARLQEGETWRGELVVRSRSGSPLVVEVAESPVVDEVGRLVAVIGVSSDVTERKRGEEELQRQAVLLDLSRDAIVVCDFETDVVTFWNRGAELMYGFAAAEALGRTPAEIMHGVSGNRLRQIKEIVCRTGVWQGELRHIRADGSDIVVMSRWTLQRGPGGVPAAVMESNTDITERVRAEALIREREERYRSVLDASLDGVIVGDPGGRILFANHQAATLLGFTTRDELIGQPYLDLIPEEERTERLAGIARFLSKGKSATVTMELRRRDGTVLPVSLSASIVKTGAGQALSFTAVIHDLTEQLAAQHRLEYQATHDSLTGLPNRAMFQTRLDELLNQSKAPRAALLLLDLDRFKEVNDALGHRFGDELLILLAERLRSLVREGDTVARLGGDEFAVLLPGAPRTGAVLVAEKLLAGVEQAFNVDDHTFYLGASVGIALAPEHGVDGASLTRFADVAMYAAKRSRAGYRVYEAGSDPHTPERLAMIVGLRRAIEANELELHYQPKINLLTGCADHVEALLRWRRSDGRHVPPSEFIPVAEQTGLIRSLTDWVLDSALRQSKQWRENGMDIEIAVNLSAWNVLDRRIVPTLANLLKRWKIPASALTVEITESAILSDPAQTMSTISQLHGMGIHISIDDFGTGYSSLALLKRLPIDEIKIDHSFVGDMKVGDPESLVIVRSVIDLGHNLGLQVVAEGVESEIDLEMLRSMGADLAQGYFITPPLTAEDFESWWRVVTANRAIA